MKQAAIGLLLCITAMASSCKKDTDNPAVVYDNYSALKTGNYWVYRLFEITPSGDAVATSNFDSCYIEKDTLIKGTTYYKMVRPNNVGMPPVSYLRDSLHYTVDNDGMIWFSSENFSSTFRDYYYVLNNLNDTVAHITTNMADKDVVVNVPAGSFTTSSFQTTFDMWPNYDDAGDIRRMNTRYAKGVGIVSETLQFYTANPNYFERRLVNYNVQ